MEVCINGWEPSFRMVFGFLGYSLCTRRTDGRTDGGTKAKLIAPFLTGGGIINHES